MGMRVTRPAPAVTHIQRTRFVCAATCICCHRVPSPRIQCAPTATCPYGFPACIFCSQSLGLVISFDRTRMGAHTTAIPTGTLRRRFSHAEWRSAEIFTALSLLLMRLDHSIRLFGHTALWHAHPRVSRPHLLLLKLGDSHLLEDAQLHLQFVGGCHLLTELDLMLPYLAALFVNRVLCLVNRLAQEIDEHLQATKGEYKAERC
jgi:hypothetical protein